MANSALTITEITHPSMSGTEQNTIVLDWLSDDAAGTLDFDIAATYSTAQAAKSSYLVQPSKIKGYIKGIMTAPGEDGDLATALPTNLYDVTLENPYGYDLAGGALADRSGTVAEKVIPSQPVPIDSEITVKILHAGNARQGRIILYVAPTE